MMKVIISLLLLMSACSKQEFPTHFSVPTTTGVFKTEEQRGKNIFLFFGFTQCPHVCPLTLKNLNLFIQMLPEYERKSVEVVFVSVDLERDSMATLKERLKGFPPNFHGAMDSEANLKKLLEKFGASFNVIKGKDPTDIIIDHTALIFMLNKKSEWVDSLKYDSTPEQLLAAYQNIDRKTPVSAHHRQNRVIDQLGENTLCDLSKSPCEIDGYTMELGPFPITSEKEFTVTVRTASKLGKPLEVDFEGVENNMGLIRPKLIEGKAQTFEGKFSIPVCELSEMKWRARLILETPTGPKSLNFYFNTVQPLR